MNDDQPNEVIAETENLLLWRSDEPEGHVYHLELGHLSLHLSSEEWEELLTLILSAAQKRAD